MTLPVDGIKPHRGNFAAVCQRIQPLLDAGQCFRLQVNRIVFCTFRHQVLVVFHPRIV